MLITKFIGCNIHEPLNRTLHVFNINALKHSIITKFDEYLQFIGFQDANKIDIYEGDVLELVVTPELMKDGILNAANTTIGEIMKKSNNVYSIILHISNDNSVMGVTTGIYLRRKHPATGEPKLDKNKNHSPANYEIRTDATFPMYLCKKGAIIIGNAVADPDIFDTL